MDVKSSSRIHWRWRRLQAFATTGLASLQPQPGNRYTSTSLITQSSVESFIHRDIILSDDIYDGFKTVELAFTFYSSSHFYCSVVPIGCRADMDNSNDLNGYVHQCRAMSFEHAPKPSSASFRHMLNIHLAILASSQFRNWQVVLIFILSLCLPDRNAHHLCIIVGHWWWSALSHSSS